MPWKRRFLFSTAVLVRISQTWHHPLIIPERCSDRKVHYLIRNQMSAKVSEGVNGPSIGTKPLSFSSWEVNFSTTHDVLMMMFGMSCHEYIYDRNVLA